MVMSAPAVRVRLRNGADAVSQTELAQLCRDNTPIRALIGMNRGSRKVSMTVTLCTVNRPVPCYGYGHRKGCPDEKLGNIRNQPRNIIRWSLKTKDGVSWIEGYRV